MTVQVTGTEMAMLFITNRLMVAEERRMMMDQPTIGVQMETQYTEKQTGLSHSIYQAVPLVQYILTGVAIT